MLPGVAITLRCAASLAAVHSASARPLSAARIRTLNTFEACTAAGVEQNCQRETHVRLISAFTTALMALTFTSAIASPSPDEEEQLVTARPDNAEFCSKNLGVQPGTQAFVN